MDLDRKLAQFSEEHYGTFTTAHARFLGFTDDQIEDRIDSGRWQIWRRCTGYIPEQRRQTVSEVVS